MRIRRTKTLKKVVGAPNQDLRIENHMIENDHEAGTESDLAAVTVAVAPAAKIVAGEAGVEAGTGEGEGDIRSRTSLRFTCKTRTIGTNVKP